MNKIISILILSLLLLAGCGEVETFYSEERQTDLTFHITENTEQTQIRGMIDKINRIELLDIYEIDRFGNKHSIKYTILNEWFDGVNGFRILFYDGREYDIIPYYSREYVKKGTYNRDEIGFHSNIEEDLFYDFRFYYNSLLVVVKDE